MDQPKEHDQMFAQPRGMASDFAFDKDTAAVFDDMVSRSVPFYHEIQRMTGEIAGDFGVDGTALFDMGCATGTTLIELDQWVSPGVRFVGVDSAPQMLEKAKQKIEEHGFDRPYDLRQADLHRDSVVENGSVVVMVLTLQFMRPLYRERVIKDIARGLNERGCLILVEKLTAGDSLFNRLFIKHYHEYKRRRGYSDMEIAQKREALENVLIPYRLDENRELLLSSGFRHAEVFFRWYNFCGILAVK